MKGYDDTLFPSEMREMDQEALVQSEQEIRDKNAAEIDSLNTNHSNFTNV